MMVDRVEFRYIEYYGRNYPLVPLRLLGSNGKLLVYALVDSGATISLFHRSIAEYAGIELGDAKPVYLAGVGGYVKALLKRRVDIEIEGIGRLMIPIAFTEYIASDIMILGREGFFESLKITFREKDKVVALEKPRGHITLSSKS
ncbi:MAG: retropepsin-like domain-containing protein [Caldisphaeraceae archaeon]|nr:retropepsin-like domain-containing protein [Caldisphaeraceae archaeon]